MALGTTTISFEEGVTKLFERAFDKVREVVDEMNRPAREAMEAMTKLQKKHEIQTERIEAQELEKGDIIVEFHSGRKPSQEEVMQIEHSACCTRGTHVNNKSCYPARALVWIRI